MRLLRQRFGLVAVLIVVALATGCAFDISQVRQQPARFTAVTPPGREFILTQGVRAKLGTGFPTVLKAGTRWHPVGSLEQEDVFTTKDQVVVVEASNSYRVTAMGAAVQPPWHASCCPPRRF